MPSGLALDPRYERLIEELVSSGRFRSPADVVAAGLNLLEAELAVADNDRLRALIREGIDSGPGIPADEVFARLRSKYAAMPGRGA
ncbi:MAG: type II toxin-antitoxin system ParD family antitoxin [Alphaproteobacteria bacterium]|nr:type II toxin-antitoxin system ParD family antitoxin [Alphaproteobacteria bacterium]